MRGDRATYGEAAGESRKAAHQFHQFVVTLGNFERDHQQGEREGKDRVAERFEARNVMAAREHARHITAATSNPLAKIAFAV